MAKTLRIAVQGIAGSFSETAGITFAKTEGLGDYTLKYCLNSENVLVAIEEGEVDYGIFAIENAQGGVVIESVEALAHHHCHIAAYFHIPITQNLLVYPGTSRNEVQSIHSHQQALRQCRDYLAKHFWGTTLTEENDTADAARRLQTGELAKTAAVIANANCASLYQLEILTPDIQDLKHNLTLFIAATQLKKDSP